MTARERAEAVIRAHYGYKRDGKWNRAGGEVDAVAGAIAEAVAAERERCLAAVAEVRERAENGRKLPGPNVGVLADGALSALKGVEGLIREGANENAPAPPGASPAS